MKELLPVGCVIMASGLSQRFGSNKLLAPFCGEPMLCRAFAATDTPKLSARIVVTRSDEVAQLCRSRNVPVLLHDLPGRNDTVRLGLSALLEQVPELFGCMFLPGDQPLLCRETVEAMAGISGWDQRTRLERQKETEREIFRLGFRVRNDPSPLTGSPVLFEKDFFRNCSPCRRAWAEVFCFGNIPRMFTPFTLRIGMNWPTPTRPKHLRNWKRWPGKSFELYTALSSFGSSTFSRIATNAAGTMPDSPQISCKACGACARMPLLAPMP